MSRRRETTEEERALFESALKDALRIEKKTAAAVRLKPGAAKARLKGQVAADAPLPGLAPHRAAPGVDGRTAGRLLRGTLEPDARLDLHGMTEPVAHRALVSFVRGAALRGCRLLLVVTGKGLGAPDPYEAFDLELVQRRRGVLRTLVPRWLEEPELAGVIADVRRAHRRHGGAGALYVYLRKSR